jgi:hypothetical protein
MHYEVDKNKGILVQNSQSIVAQTKVEGDKERKTQVLERFNGASQV